MTLGKATSAALVLGMGLLAGGCEAQPVWTSPPGSERYQIGYHDGCENGLAIAGNSSYERIDSAEPAYKDEDYVDGWQLGFFDCKRKQERIQATLHSMFGTGN